MVSINGRPGRHTPWRAGAVHLLQALYIFETNEQNWFFILLEEEAVDGVVVVNEVAEETP
jgi:hypothetical protein